MTIGTENTSYDEALSDRSAINDANGFKFPGTNPIESNELLPNVLTKKNHFNSRLGGERQVVNDRLGPDKALRVDVTRDPEPQTVLEDQGLDQGTSNPMEERKIVETSRKIATRNLEMSINENDGFNKTAWIMENGEPFCNHCDSNFVPEHISAKMACTNCGCGRPNDDHGVLDTDFETQDQMDGVVASHELPMDIKSDGMVGSDMVKVAPDNEVTPYTGTTSASRLATTEDYLELFKTSSDSDLYVKGYMDAMNSKPLDTELAEVSDDYFHGYQQYQFYHTSPQEKAPQNLYDIKPNSNQLPRTMDVGTQEELMGPNELTNRHDEVVGSRLPFPSDVVQKFFNEA